MSSSETERSSNLEFWNSVDETDPEYTKEVKYGSRQFTAIDAQYKLKRLTEEFGKCGEGWGYNARAREVIVGEQVIAVVEVTFWYKVPGREYSDSSFMGNPNEFGPVTGACPLVSKGRVDNDAYKKAETDALTKCASRLGFFADVFMGEFDGENKPRQSQDAVVARAIVAIAEAGGDEEKRSAIYSYACKQHDLGEITDESLEKINAALEESKIR